jgi:hypothetical protein
MIVVQLFSMQLHSYLLVFELFFFVFVDFVMLVVDKEWPPCYSAVPFKNLPESFYSAVLENIIPFI